MLMFFWLFCLLVATSVQAQTPTHHVAKTGCSDAGSGVISGTPWCTIGKALTTATAGSTVLVRAGTYYERVVPTVSGSAGNMITLMGERGTSGERLAILDGSDLYTGGWTLANATYGNRYQTNSVPYNVGWVGIDQGGQTYHILMAFWYNKPGGRDPTLFDPLDVPANYQACVSYISCWSYPYPPGAGADPSVDYWSAWEVL